MTKIKLRKEDYILNNFVEDEKTECGVAFCRNVSSYVRINFTVKPVLKNNLELYAAIVLCKDHYKSLN
ncbi:hypothetical protein [Spiroplasma sp. DGKH1]|uniref:hypothetical protein n=1 Tax=Spiroplasma sp. DGKH1 TaxID=3050074 RepID=UPI0034C644EA